MEKIVIGLTEKVKIKGEELTARMDTGAHRNSISKELADKLNLGPVIGQMVIKSSNGREKRPIIEAELEIKGRKFKSVFNLANRSQLRYPVLIGQEILRKGFLIDPSK